MDRTTIIGYVTSDAKIIDNPKFHGIIWSVGIDVEGSGKKYYKCVVRFAGERITIPKYYSFIKKGAVLCCEGRCYIETWINVEGNKESRLALSIENVEQIK